MADLSAAGDFLQKLGLLGGAILVIWGAYKRWWYTPGYVNDRDAQWQARLNTAIEDRDFWRNVAMRAQTVQDKALEELSHRLGNAST